MADVSLSTDVMQSDLSVQVLNKIFGAGWENIASLLSSSSQAGSDAAMGTLIYDLLSVLNSCCALVVAWLFLLTTLCATLGAAQDGHGIAGRRYSNAWIPLRYTFAMGAVTPVFAGMNALQIIVLASIGMSIGFADSMWDTALEHISDTGAVTATSGPYTDRAAQRILPVVYQNAFMRSYLEKGSWKCTFSDTPRNRSAGQSGDNYVISFELPYATSCATEQDVAQELASMPGDWGSVIIRTPSGDAAQAMEQAFLDTVYPKALEVAGTLLEAYQSGDFAFERATARGVAQTYTSAVGPVLSKAALGADSARTAAIDEFAQTASAQGWFMAGSYYWTLAKISADAVSMQADFSEGGEINYDAVSAALWDPNMRQVVRWARDFVGAALRAGLDPQDETDADTAAQAGRMSTPEDDSFLGTLLSGFDTFRLWFQEGFRLDDDTVVSGLLESLGTNDIMICLVRTARGFMNTCEDVILGALAVKGVSELGKMFASSKGFDLSAISSAGETSWNVLIVVFVIAAPIWLLCWFYAYIVPMIPFVAWFTAVVGWIVLALEAVVACPVWLIGHCMPEGDGFAGHSARAGYALILSVLLRPLLLLLSFFLCMIVMSVSGDLIGRMVSLFLDATMGAFSADANSWMPRGFGVTSTVAALVLLGTIVGIGTWKLFTLVTVMPDRIIRWAGQLIANLGDDGARTNVQQSLRQAQEMGSRIAGLAVGGGALGSVLARIRTRGAAARLQAEGARAEEAALREEQVAHEYGQGTARMHAQAADDLFAAAGPASPGSDTGTPSPAAGTGAEDDGQAPGGRAQARRRRGRDSSLDPGERT